MNYAITRYGIEYTRKHPVWFLRYNVHVHYDPVNSPLNPHLTINMFLVGASEKLFRLIGRFPTQLALSDTQKGELINAKNLLGGVTDKKDVDENRRRFCQAIRVLSEAIRRRPVFILDNLDAFFHLHDKYLFLSNENSGELSEIRDILNILNNFYHGQTDLGDLGANVLFVVRPDTYEIMAASKSIYQGTEGAFTLNRHTFSLEAPNWSDVVFRRTNLLTSVINEIPQDSVRNKVKDDLSLVIDSLVQSTKQSGQLIPRLRELTNFGLRDIMHFISHYSWIPNTRDSEAVSLTDRYISNYPVGLIAFMLANRRRYSEFFTKFPNIYLCNIHESEDDHITTMAGAKGQSRIPPWSQHSYSYWIKHLILAYVAHKNDAQQMVKIGDVIDVFCGTPPTSYDDSFVRLMVGSLAENHAANLIRVGREMLNDRNLTTGALRVTPRGRQCLDHIFDRFFYLQLIVDDYMLPLPTQCSDTFAFEAKVNYSYLSSEGHVYGDLTKRMVQKKSILTLKFLAILSIAFETEELRYSGAFSRLRMERVKLPNPSYSKDSLLDQFDALKTRFDSTAFGFSRSELEAHYVSMRNRVRSSIEGAYGF